MKSVVLSLMCLLLFPVVAFASDTAKGAGPLMISDASARWSFQQKSHSDILNGSAHIEIQGHRLEVGYDDRNAVLFFKPDFESSLETVGEMTIDGETLVAYRACFDDDSLACRMIYHGYELHLDSAALKQLEQGRELRFTVTTYKGKIYTMRYPLNGVTRALRQVRSSAADQGMTPLMLALAERNLDRVIALLNSGGSLTVKDNRGRTPLLFVAPAYYSGDDLTESDKNFMRLLVQHGADINAPNKMGTPLLNEMAETCDVEMVRFLLSLGADPNSRDAEGDTPLLNSYQNRKFLDIYPVLTAAGAVSRTINNNGQTVLHKFAGKAKSSHVIEFLIKEGFAVNRQDSNGAIPLMYAAYLFQYDNVRTLLKNGALIDLATNDGHTAISLLQTQAQEAERNNNSRRQKAFESMIKVLEDSRYFRIYFKNKTSEKIQVAIRLQEDDGS